MSGAVEICKRYAEMSGKREAAERAAGNEEGAAFESGSTITAMNLAELIARTTPPARSYADGVEDAAKRAEQWMRPNADIIARNLPAAIRLLSQGEKA